VEKEAVFAELLAGPTVQMAVPVSGIADDRVAQVGKVAAQLVAAPRLRGKRAKGQARGGITPRGGWMLVAGKGFVMGEGGLQGMCATWTARILQLECIIDDTGFREPATRKGQVPFLNPAFRESGVDQPEQLRVTGQQENPAGGPVKPVAGMPAAAGLFAQEGDQVRRGVAGHRGGMDQQPGGLVHREKAVGVM